MQIDWKKDMWKCVTNNEHVRATKVPKMGLSDHFPLCYTQKHNSQYRNKTHITMKCRSFREFDEKLFVEDLEYVPWNLCEVFDDPNEALDCWQKRFLDVVDQSILCNTSICLKKIMVRHVNKIVVSCCHV